MEQIQPNSALLSLPTDALLVVLGSLGPRDLLRCTCCCRLLYALSRSDCLWLSLCTPWRHLLHLPSWRLYVHSAPSLFHLLSAFDRLVGTWTAQGDNPRGTLLYVTWGNCCLVACKALACKTGELKLSKAFEIYGVWDSAFKLEFIIKDPEKPLTLGNRLFGKLVWDSKNASDFTVQAIEQDQTATTNDLSFGQQVLEYLIRIASPTRHNLNLTGHPDKERNTDQNQVVGCSYRRLTVAEPMKNGDLVGLWVGVYGPHGAEIINVTETQDGIFGTKVLGDPNVPCGQVSFRAGRFETSQVRVELQQIMDLEMRTSRQAFNIARLSQGYGRIADDGFLNPSWVPGYLLVSDSGQIAFLWAANMNFVVPFEKLNLAALYESFKC